jgi:hypothetical protein
LKAEKEAIRNARLAAAEAEADWQRSRDKAEAEGINPLG